LENWVQTHWQKKIEFIKSSEGANGFKNGYENPEKLGVDRFVSLMAAWKQTKGSLCIVSCGTCIVIDAIDNQGQHLGGWITPGLMLLQESVIKGTTGCATVQLNFQPKTNAIAHNTQDAVTQGCLRMAAEFINQTISELKKQLGKETKIILSGGDAQVVKPFLTENFEYIPNLVLQGLAEF
jgi:type III pantothenate kinase